MGSMNDIQSTLEAGLEVLSERGSGSRAFFEAIGETTKQFGIRDGADQEIQTFLSAAVPISTYNAFASVDEGEPGKASWLVVRVWQDALRATRDHPVLKLLEYHLAVYGFLDAEVRFSRR